MVIRKIGGAVQTVACGVVIILCIIFAPILCEICDGWERAARQQDEAQRRTRMRKQ